LNRKPRRQGKRIFGKNITIEEYMLKEEDRTKLDGIVSQMETNGEKPEDIQFVVNDFKSKYDQPEQPQETFFLGRAVDRIGELPKRFKAEKEEQGGGLLGAINAGAGEVLRAGGDIAGDLTTTAAKAVIPERFRPAIKGAIGNTVSSALNTPGIKQAKEAYESLPENQRYNIESGLMAIPSAKPAQLLTGGLVKGAGNLIKNAGRSAYMQEVGVLKPLAKKVAPTLKKAKQKIGDTIEKYQLDSPLGFNTATEKADALFDQKWQQADDLIEKYSVENPNDVTNFLNIVNQAKKDIPDNFRPGERHQASGVVDNIVLELYQELVDKGINPARMTPVQLVEAKRSIGAKYKNFDRTAEPVKEAAYDALESLVIRRINDFVPEAGALNLEARDIRNAKDAIEEAAGRNNKLSNWIATGAEAGGAASAMVHSPGAIPKILLATIGVDAARRALLSGRGASVLMRAGKGIKGIGEKISPTKKQPPAFLKMPKRGTQLTIPPEEPGTELAPYVYKGRWKLRYPQKSGLLGNPE
jgi:hypothetical protein